MYSLPYEIGWFFEDANVRVGVFRLEIVRNGAVSVLIFLFAHSNVLV